MTDAERSDMVRKLRSWAAGSEACCDYRRADESNAIADALEEIDGLREALEFMMTMFSADGLLRRGAEVNAAVALARHALSAPQLPAKP